MEIVSWIIVELITGSVARIVMPGPAAGGIKVAILIGLVGAFIGGIIGTTVSVEDSAPALYALLCAVNGALYSLFGYRCFALRLRDLIKTPAKDVLKVVAGEFVSAVSG